MKKILIYTIPLFALFGAATGCDSRRDVFFEGKEKPSLALLRTYLLNAPAAGAITIEDSLKLFPGNRYPYLAELADPKLVLTFSVSGQNLGGSHYMGGTAWDGMAVEKETGTLQMHYEPLVTGSHTFGLMAEDKYENKAFADVKLTVFDNLPPVASLNVLQQQNLMPLERIISGAGSYDRDEKFGGFLERWLFTVNSNTVTDTVDVPFNGVNYIFPSPGQYNISLRVKDNNGVWSPSVSGTYTIN